MQPCANCNQLNAPDARFCASCGLPLAPASERREERKVVTVLFADMVGFTSRAEGMDVEDVRAMLAPYHALVRQQLEQRRGTVEKFIGDAVMAVFGAPAAHEDDPERAVRAAVAIGEALAASNERHPELDLHVRIGVNTGEALVALDARPAAGEGLASGDVVNTAARLQAAAPIDGIVVGDATYRATREAFEYEEMAPVQAKGKAEPVPCWQVLRPRSRIGETRSRPDATPLVDRKRELKTLIDAFEETQRNSTPQILTLVGVPGIGKSRLVREFFHDLDRRPDLIRWREGRSPPYGQGAALTALGDIVKAEVGLLESHEPADSSTKLAAAVASVIEDPDQAAWVEGHLRGLVGLDAESSLFGDRRAEAFAAWRLFVERLAQRRPTVLVLEDVHWADDALLDFVDHLVSWLVGVQLFVLCTARPELLERRPAWAAARGTSRVLALDPLSEVDTRELFDALLGEAALPAETRSALLSGAAGNPLYAQEFVRMLVDRGLLERADGGWKLEPIGELPVPDSVLGIIAARLDAVPLEDKAVIQDASVVGKVFWPGAVACVAERGKWAIEEALLRLEQRQLVRRRHDSSLSGDSEWVFEHALIRDVAYRTIVRPQRAQKHRRAAEWLSSLPGGRRDRADTIAHHYVTALENAKASGQMDAGLRPAAAEALRAAAEHASSVHSHVSAARLWSQALELCSADDRRRARWLLALGKSLALADEPAAPTLDEAASELLAAGDLIGAAEAESMSAWLLSLAGKPERARERDRRAFELARKAAPSPTKALILSSSGAHAVFVRGRRDEALAHLEEALTIAESLGLREIESEALQFIGMARLDAGEEQGVRDIERALATAVDLNSPVALSCYGNLADMRRYFGDLRESAALHVDGERAAERFAIPVQVRRFRAEQACDLYYSGDWDEALAHVEEYLDAVKTRSPHRGIGEARVHRGRIRLARGDGRGAIEDAEAALEFARTTAEPFNLFPALAFHARALAAAAPERAEESAEELLTGLVAGQPFWGAWILPDVVGCMGGEGRLASLRRTLAGATPHSRWYDAVVATLEGDFARAADLYAAIGSRPDEAVARLRAAEHALATDDAGEAQAQLTRAQAFFDRVGAHALLRDAKALASA